MDPAIGVAVLMEQLRGIDQRLGGIEADVAEVKTQAKLTNGRVSAHDIALAEQRGAAEALATATAVNRDRADRRFTRAAWAVSLTFTVLIAVVGWLLAHLT